MENKDRILLFFMAMWEFFQHPVDWEIEFLINDHFTVVNKEPHKHRRMGESARLTALSTMGLPKQVFRVDTDSADLSDMFLELVAAMEHYAFENARLKFKKATLWDS